MREMRRKMVRETSKPLVPLSDLFPSTNSAQYATRTSDRKLSFGSATNVISAHTEDAASSAVHQVCSEPLRTRMLALMMPNFRYL